jgi:hypothetical protein
MTTPRRKALITLAAIGAAPSAAQAQLDKLLGGLGGILSGSNKPAESGNIVQTYIEADRDVLLANGDMAEALGLKDAAALARATAAALSDGATVDGLKEADKVVADSNGLIRQELDKSPKLDAKSKEKFASGLVKLVKGVRRYSSLRKSVERVASLTSPTSFFSGGSSGGVSQMVYVGTAFPGGMKNLGSALQSAITYAQNNDIPVPPDATAALAGL